MKDDHSPGRSRFNDQRFDFAVRYSTRALYAKSADEHRDEHFKCTQFAFEKDGALSAIGKILDVVKLMFQDSPKVSEIHFYGIIADEHENIIAFAKINIAVAVKSYCRSANVVNLGLGEINALESLQLSAHIDIYIFSKDEEVLVKNSDLFKECATVDARASAGSKNMVFLIILSDVFFPLAAPTTC